MIFVKKSAADVLDASGKYLRCLGYFFWSLGILNVSRMVTQGLGYSGRAVLSGVTEMLMGTEVPPRRAFIYENATEAELDI